MLNYLDKTQTKSKDVVIDCSLTSNYDERYAKAYPKLTSGMLVDLIAHYPDSSYEKLESIISKTFDFEGDLILGNGSENLIMQINRFLSDKQYSVKIVLPIFYRITETLDATLVKTIAEDEFFRGTPEISVNAIWLQNPNLFTGKIHDKNTLLEIIDSHKNILFIIDEAGIFTFQDWKKYSLLSNADKRENLIIVSSFSKIFGISGLRAGFASGPKKYIGNHKKE